jgi:hypothetical protein
MGAAFVLTDILPIPKKHVHTVTVKFYNDAERERYNNMATNSMETFQVCHFEVHFNVQILPECMMF